MSSATDSAQVSSKHESKAESLSDGALSPVSLEKGGPVDVPEKTWAKIDLYVLPVITLMYFLSSLDRSNIGNARIAGLQQVLHMDNTQYSIALTVTLIPYTLIELPSNALMKYVTPRIMLPTMVVLWGITCTLQGVVTSYSGLLAARFFLGLFEGGLLPGISLYLSSFYPRRKLQLRQSILFSATAFASAFSGLLAAAIIKMEGVGNRPGWAWLFILEGLFTVIFGIATFWLLPNSPTSVPTLEEDERSLITDALHEDGILLAHEKDDHYNLTEWLATFKQPHVLFLAVVGFLNGSTLSGLAYFLPSIVVGLGYAGSRAQLMSVPPFAVSAVLSILSSFFSDYYGRRGLTIIFFSAIASIGFGIFYGTFVSHIRYGSLFLLVPGTYAIGPPLGTWIANNSSPLIRRATSLALLTTMTNLGSILSTWLLGAISPAPKYTSATITLLVFQFGILLAAAGNVAYLTRENKRKAKAREGATRDESPTGLPNESIWFKYVL